jgi:spore maturation protein CgeB
MAPEAYATSRITLHIPRKEYLQSLRGTPTIRVFEALACGIPLISAGWRDGTGMFEDNADYLVVDGPSQMAEAIRWLTSDEDARRRIGSHGRETILARHTCAHRAEQLVDIVQRINLECRERE